MDNKLKLILPDLEMAIISFEHAMTADLSKYDESEKDWIKNGQVQKFEYSIELLWKTIKAYFKIKFEADINFPIENLKEFFRQELIDEDTYNTLYDAIKSRNLLSHVYKLEMFELVYPQLIVYLPAIKKAHEAIKLHTI